MKLGVLFNFFIPKDLRNDIVADGQAKIIVCLSLLLGLILLLQSARPFSEGDVVMGMVLIGAGLLVFVAPVLLKATGSLLISGNSITFLLFLLLGMIAAKNGGTSNAATANLTLVVLIAYLVAGMRSGLAWGVVCIGSILAMHLANQSGYLPTLQETAQQAEAYSFVTYMVNTLMVLIIGFIFQFNGSRNLNKLAVEKEISREANKDLSTMLSDVDCVMEAVAASDLSQTVTTKLKGNIGRLKDSVNNAIRVLSQAIFEVVDSAGQFTVCTNEIFSSAQSLANGTTDQAASLEQISSSMSEVENQVKTNNENASQSEKLTEQALDIVQQGNRQMDLMLHSIKEISQTSTNVSRVIKVIDEIAFQTNLLALNAAVEAARAGKYEKGFAVVAEEVRNLASRSAEAAKDTTDLIEASLKEVEAGVTNADKTAETLAEISTSVEKVNDLVKEIATGSQEQKAGIEEINRGLIQVNDVVQQNSSISEQTASAAQELSAQATRVQGLMGKFRLNQVTSLSTLQSQEDKSSLQIENISPNSFLYS